jgi:hypothetical protein
MILVSENRALKYLPPCKDNNSLLSSFEYVTLLNFGNNVPPTFKASLYIFNNWMDFSLLKSTTAQLISFIIIIYL